jgi:acyl carrier protein
MQDKGTAFDRFASLIAQIVSIEIDHAALARDTTLAGDLMLDSISLISLMALTEEQFGVSFAEHTEQVANLRTVGDAADLIESLAAQKA